MLLLLVSPSLIVAAGVEELHLSSGPEQVALVELFTSEGCSSCPPADRWLSKLKSSPGLWKEFTPIAFHVDYWDYIGWTDRFAQARFSDRQRRYADEGAVRFVYTPGYFRAGAEWLGWRRNAAIAVDGREVGELNLLVSGDDIAGRFEPVKETDEALTLHVAVLGMNLETDVRAGENATRRLQHDFVALGVVSVQMDRARSGFRAATKLPDISPTVTEQAIVAWVSAGKSQEPVQSVGGFLSNR